jgi:regulator of ribonuclease activity A
MSELLTADLYDEHGETLQVMRPGLRDFGGRRRADGIVATVRCFEDNSRVREALAEPGEGRILVVDGGGSLRCALLGDNLAQRAVDSGWTGVVVHGCIRDSAVIATMPLLVRALDTVPRKTVKRGEGQRDLPLRFLDVTVRPGDRMVLDEDGAVVLMGHRG